MLRETDKAAADLADEQIPALLAKANDALCADLKIATDKLLGQVLYITSCISRSQRTSCSGRCSTSRAAR